MPLENLQPMRMTLSVSVFFLLTIAGTAYAQEFGEWKSFSCYSNLQFCVKKGAYNDQVQKFTWYLKLRNRYSSDISFSVTAKESFVQNAQTDARFTLRPQEERQTWYMIADDRMVNVFVDKVRFGADAGGYVPCGGLPTQSISNTSSSQSHTGVTAQNGGGSAWQPSTGSSILIQCASGLKLSLLWSKLGSCTSTANEQGTYYSYNLIAENISSSAIEFGGYYYFFKGTVLPPSGNCSFFSQVGEWVKLQVYASTLHPYQRKENKFALGFVHPSQHEALINQAIQLSQNHCGSSHVPANASTSVGAYQTHAVRARQYENDMKYDLAISEWQLALSLKPGDTEATRAIERLNQKQIKKNKDDYAAKNVSDQNKRNAKERAAQASIFASMAAIGGFMYNNITKDTKRSTYARGAWRFNFNIGYSFTSQPIYEPVESESYNGVTMRYDYYVSNSSSNTMNLDLGLQFWPYYGDHFGLGLLAEGNGGYFPLAGENVSYTYQYGLHALLGPKAFKVSIRYLMGDRGASFSNVYSDEFGKRTSQVEGASTFRRSLVGTRISFGQAHPRRHLDFYYVIENYPNLNNIKGNGFQISYESHNRLRIYGETMLKAARVGVVGPEFTKTLSADGVRNTGMYIRFGVIRMIDRFGQ